jgi:hypothetical protein
VDVETETYRAVYDPTAAREEEWTIDGMTYHELIVQPYRNMAISAGEILDGVMEGHERNTVYLRLERDDGEETFLRLTDDELAAIAWVCNGVLWSRLDGRANSDE